VTAQRENRRFRALARKRVSLAATLSHAHAGWRLEARVTDLSLGGARIQLTSKALSEGDRVKLSLATPTLWDPIELTAVVAWQRVDGDHVSAGVWFDNQHEDDLLSLFDLLATAG
jgi:PilZ domain